jgi:eukaryotic-like serine/threonine-protein kinase
MRLTPDDPSIADDPRLLVAVQEYLTDLEAGRRPDRRAYAARFPDLSTAMAPYLDAIDMVHGAAAQVQSTSSGRATPLAPEPLIAEPLGDFHIVREIGRGGMGIVYEAVQRSLGRRVALKVLPFAAALDSRQLQRFRNEAQAAAHLHHQNIVPVYAVGSERGVHFYAMQLIEGQNLAALIASLAPRASDPPPTAFQADTRSALSAQLTTQRSQRNGDCFRTIAELVAQAADGLDYAHGLGIVHRDIKPANLLVDDRRNVWITDFGLAQFQASAGLTQTGDLLGTLRYMSPEQAAGLRVPTDHRTDVYSLGATLYELLTLQPIFDGEDRQALLQQIMHAEPRPPRSIDRSIPVELETIVHKAIAKAPAERYGTARDLADDLRRYLRYEPIRARRATLMQHGRKWLRRHPSIVGSAVVLLVLMTAGSLLSAWLIRGEQEKTRHALELERARGQVVEEQFRIARRSLAELIELAEKELADKPDMQGLRKRLLESALADFQRFIEQRGDDPAAKDELAATRARVQKILGDLAVLQGAGQFALLKEPAVLDDLRLEPDQRAELKDVAKRLDRQHQDSIRMFHLLTPAEREQRLIEVARANEHDATAILTPGQLRRLRQIELQVGGAAAMRDADVALKLNLSTEQKKKLRAVEAETSVGPPPKGPPFDKGGPGSRKGQLQHRKRAQELMLAVLTPEQAKQWREMIGEPYEGPAPWVPRFGPPGPPRGPGGPPFGPKKN